MEPESDPEIRRIALKEARERLDEVTRILADGQPEPGTREFETLWRHAHSLKGLGNIVGSPDAERASIQIMRALDDMTAHGIDAEAFTRVTRDVTDIAASFDQLESRRPRLP